MVGPYKKGRLRTADKWCHRFDAGSIDAKGVMSFKTAGTRAKAEKLFDLKAEGEFNQSVKATINGQAGGGLDTEGDYSFRLAFLFLVGAKTAATKRLQQISGAIDWLQVPST